MIIENMTREEMITFIKKNCVKIIKDIPNTNFKAGEYYQCYQDEGGDAIIDDEGNWFDLYDLKNPQDFLETK